MTSGERMVWAVAFDRAMASGMSAHHAAFVAQIRVKALQDAAAGALAEGDDETRAGIDDMLGTGADR